MYAYRIDKSKLPTEIRENVIEFSESGEARTFVVRMRRRQVPRWKTRVFAWLRKYVDFYDIHARLSMYEMHLLGGNEWYELTRGHQGTLLDVGAGQGFITEKAREFFDDIAVNEKYKSMEKRLSRRGLRIVKADFEKDVSHIKERFDVVSVLNVIDRCDKPITLLKNCLSVLKDDGIMIIADPLPLKPVVLSRKGNRRPVEALPQCDEEGWEECFTHFYNEVLKPLRLKVEKLTRLPYLSQSDNAFEPIVAYDDMVVVVSRA